jgi:hypothetical protein
MTCAANLDFGNCAALEAAQQNPSQTVADRVSESAFERFGHELSVVTGQGASVTNDLTWKLETAPANVHGNISEISVCPVFLRLGRRPLRRMTKRSGLFESNRGRSRP